jgi:hypothetical protein
MFLTDRFDGAAYDCFIIGSGPAGLTAALALGEAGRRVLVFESGDADVPRNELSNSVGYGHYSGAYWNLHWIRALGGTSERLDRMVRHRARNRPRQPCCRRQVAHRASGAGAVLAEGRRDPRSRSAIHRRRAAVRPGLHLSARADGPPTRFGQKFRDQLEAPGRVDVALGRTIVGFDANASRSIVTSIEYVDHQLDLRRKLTVAPKQTVIVAAGAMGNAQLFLQPRSDGAVPVGNESGMVGTPPDGASEYHSAGECVMDAEMDRLLAGRQQGDGHARPRRGPGLLDPARDSTDAACSARESPATTTWRGSCRAQSGRPHFHYDITVRSEMLPSARNRVVLTAERNRWGLHRPAARCVIDARDFQNVEQTLRIFGETLIRLGRGRVRVNNDRIYKDVWGQGHTLGTTRMGTSRDESVVDGECRVHGYENLFVGGSSVFPSGGYANPTLTIVALALRLADTIAGTR